MTMTPDKTPTPLTDAEQNKLKPFDESFTVWCARGWHFARTLEKELTAATAQLEEARRLLGELHALVKGECPSLLNEDSGGDAGLDIAISAALSPKQKEIE